MCAGASRRAHRSEAPGRAHSGTRTPAHARAPAHPRTHAGRRGHRPAVGFQAVPGAPLQGMGRPCKLKRRCRATPGAREGEKRPRPRARRRGSFAPRRMTGVALPGEHYPRKDSVGGEERKVLRRRRRRRRKVCRRRRRTRGGRESWRWTMTVTRACISFVLGPLLKILG